MQPAMGRSFGSSARTAAPGGASTGLGFTDGWMRTGRRLLAGPARRPSPGGERDVARTAQGTRFPRSPDRTVRERGERRAASPPAGRAGLALALLRAVLRAA